MGMEGRPGGGFGEDLGMHGWERGAMTRFRNVGFSWSLLLGMAIAWPGRSVQVRVPVSYRVARGQDQVDAWAQASALRTPCNLQNMQ
jgi:hypothetical protein